MSHENVKPLFSAVIGQSAFWGLWFGENNTLRHHEWRYSTLLASDKNVMVVYKGKLKWI